MTPIVNRQSPASKQRTCCMLFARSKWAAFHLSEDFELPGREVCGYGYFPFVEDPRSDSEAAGTARMHGVGLSNRSRFCK